MFSYSHSIAIYDLTICPGAPVFDDGIDVGGIGVTGLEDLVTELAVAGEEYLDTARKAQQSHIEHKIHSLREVCICLFVFVVVLFLPNFDLILGNFRCWWVDS